MVSCGFAPLRGCAISSLDAIAADAVAADTVALAAGSAGPASRRGGMTGDACSPVATTAAAVEPSSGAADAAAFDSVGVAPVTWTGGPTVATGNPAPATFSVAGWEALLAPSSFARFPSGAWAAAFCSTIGSDAAPLMASSSARSGPPSSSSSSACSPGSTSSDPSSACVISDSKSLDDGDAPSPSTTGMPPGATAGAAPKPFNTSCRFTSLSRRGRRPRATPALCRSRWFGVRSGGWVRRRAPPNRRSFVNRARRPRRD